MYQLVHMRCPLKLLRQRLFANSCQQKHEMNYSFKRLAALGRSYKIVPRPSDYFVMVALREKRYSIT